MPEGLNLPKLWDGHRIQPPDTRARWSSPGELIDLANALKVEAGTIPLRDIKSVPHTWGHVIVFESALRDEVDKNLKRPAHPGRDNAKRQWRALLAMLALRNRPGFRVATHKVDRLIGERKAVQEFARLVKKDHPWQKIDGEPAGDAIYLLYAELESAPKGEPGVLVGMLSPSTIVAPARDFAGDRRLRQFWARDGLCDPLACKEKLSPDELEVCRLFTMHLRKAIVDPELDPEAVTNASAGGEDEAKTDAGKPTDDSRADRVAELLKSFADDLRDAGAEHHIATWKEKRLNDLVGRHPRGLYKAVNSVWEDDGTAAGRTDLELKLEGEGIPLGKQTAIRFVLADRRCADTLNRRPEHVSLFGQRTLADLPEADDDGTAAPIPEHLHEEAAKQGILLLTPNDLLANCLTTLQQFDALSHPKALRKMLLPVMPVVLLLFPDLPTLDPQKLEEHLDLRGSSSQPQVQLRVTLIDHGNQRHEHVVTRVYGEGEAGVLERAYAPRALAAWPDFRLPSAPGAADREVSVWRWNYLFASTNLSRLPSNRSVLATTGVSRSILLRDLRRAASGARDAASVEHCRKRLQAWSSSEGPWSGMSGAVKGDRDAWLEWLRMRNDGDRNPHEKILQRSDSTFDAALFTLPSEGRPAYAGLGILPPAWDVQTQDTAAGGKADVALDFGTSNTIVYWKRGERSAETLPFKPRLRRFNDYRDDGKSIDDEAEYTEFMPTGTIDQPFATVMQLRRAEGVTDLDAAWKKARKPALWRDYAFFDPAVQYLTESLLSGTGTADLVFDLKWGTAPEARERMTRYLRHVTILGLAEVIGHRDLPAPSAVKWHFSYPISMVGANEYQSLIETESLNERERRDGVEFHTESHAALDYFRAAETAEVQAILVLDIGGGSTDMALDTKNKGAIWQHSVRLAGDHLMTEFLLHNRDFLECLDIALVGSSGVFGDDRSRENFMNPPVDQPPSATDRNAARAIINSPVFRTAFETRWLHIMHTEATRRLRAGASVMMGGLCRFLGLQLQALLACDSAGIGRDDLTTIRLCFGGRGSTLFKLWEKDEAFMGLTVRLTDHAGDTTDEARRGRVRAYFSQDLKHEAAKGMLASQRRGRAPFRIRDADFRVVGVAATLGQDRDVDATTFMKDVDSRNHPSDAAPVLPWEEFHSFVESVGRECGFRAMIGTVARDNIETNGRKAFSNLLRKAEPIEPPFVAMLRTTLRLIYEGKEIKIHWGDAPRVQSHA